MAFEALKMEKKLLGFFLVGGKFNRKHNLSSDRRDQQRKHFVYGDRIFKHRQDNDCFKFLIIIFFLFTWKLVNVKHVNCLR